MKSPELRKSIIFFLMIIIIVIMMKEDCKRRVEFLHPSVYSDKTPSEISMIRFALTTQF